MGCVPTVADNEDEIKFPTKLPCARIGGARVWWDALFPKRMPSSWADDVISQLSREPPVCHVSCPPALPPPGQSTWQAAKEEKCECTQTSFFDNYLDFFSHKIHNSFYPWSFHRNLTEVTSAWNYATYTRDNWAVNDAGLNSDLSNGLNTLLDSDTGMDSDSNSCPVLYKNRESGSESESVQCEKFYWVQCSHWVWNPFPSPSPPM